MTLPIVAVNHARAYPPRVTAFTRPFWSALEEGRFITVRCASCERFAFPPKPVCPHCWADTMMWEQLAAHGTLYAKTSVHAAPAVFAAFAPYPVGIVDLDDDVRIALALADPQPAIGDRIELVVLAHVDGPLFAARAVVQT